jgi:PhnB protein
MADTPSHVPDGYHTVTPYLIVPDPDGTLAFIEEAFGGTTRARHADDDGKVWHAEVLIGESVIMIGGSNDDFPPNRSTIHLYVDDVDRVFRSAVEAGGTPVREPEDQHYGDRSGGVNDPWGTQWWVARPIRRQEA